MKTLRCMDTKNNIKLSILIPSLACRTEFLSKLISALNPQLTKGVEVLVRIDNADKQIGAKRNELLDSATGEYVVFIDDDDMVSPNFIEKVLEGITSGCDYIGYAQMFHHIHTGQQSKVTTNIGATWGFKDGVYIRGVQHICPIRREIASQVRFPDKSFSEDREWGYEIEKLVKTEFTIDEPLYYYEYRQFKTGETTNGNKS